MLVRQHVTHVNKYIMQPVRRHMRIHRRLLEQLLGHSHHDVSGQRFVAPLQLLVGYLLTAVQQVVAALAWDEGR